jgi:hypothetical protein
VLYQCAKAIKIFLQFPTAYLDDEFDFFNILETKQYIATE